MRRPHPAHRPLLIALAVTSACSRAPRAIRVEGVADADALWGGTSVFCARTPRGLVCWRHLDDEGFATKPAMVPGVTQVRDVAIASSRVCAITASGVVCFEPGLAAPEPAPAFAGATQLAMVPAFGDDRICALTGSGVVCDKGAVPELGVPDRLIVGLSSGTLCGVLGHELRCLVEEGRNHAVITMQGVSSPSAVHVNATGGEVYVLDGATLRHGEFKGTLQVVGNVFAASNPLDVAVASVPLPSAAPELTTFADLTTVKTLVLRDGIWPLLLDRDGIGQIGARSHHEVERWPMPAIPQALWRGAGSMFITLENGKVHQRGWDRGKRIDHELDVVDPREVVSTHDCTCMLAAGGTVTCFYHRRH